MSKYTIFEALKRASFLIKPFALDEKVPEELLSQLLGYSTTELLVRLQEPILPETSAYFFQLITAYCHHVPAQYLLGTAVFYGMTLKVTRATLIPRPETEELVSWALAEIPEKVSDYSVLDVGTGTGAIALAMKQQRPNLDITATDISSDALAVAHGNAATLNLPISFLQGDLFAPVQNQKFDLIISNPPYIAESELAVMDESVIENEPKVALFAENEGLAFYQRFAMAVNLHLKDHGQFLLEHGFKQQTTLLRLLNKALPSYQISGRLDSYGNERMIQGIKTN